MVFARPSLNPACPQPARRRGLGIASVALAAAGALAGLSGTATASVSHPAAATPRSVSTSHHASYAQKAAQWNAESRRVIDWARKQKGKPYVYGADGPHSFDCSGLVRYVFMHAIHRSLPHNAAEQYHSIRHIRHRDLKPGDLVFVDNGGYISHVGIYASRGWWWVAPHSGERVHKQRIYRAHMLYGRAIPWPKS